MIKTYVDDNSIENTINDIIQSFNNSGKIFWQKRNTIKVFDVGDELWNVKSFQKPHLINRFAYKYVRKSKARRSFEYGKKLLQKGILTPKPLGYVEYSNLIGLTNSFYVSKNLNYDLNFEKLIDENYPDRVRILEQFTEFTHLLHEKQIHHFDHSKGNTLICKKGEGKYDFYLIDLNRMKFEKMDYQQRIDNFNRLSLTPSMIQIIGKKYASIIGVDEEKVIRDITASCEKFKAFSGRKSKWKKIIGKDLASGSGQ
ncbi:lipopolysaccharide kinase InaA family protein [Lutimonas sp.]|uniref:lipopolysaccharide kinase InaA family protein n=1 Tax=Lutimonas sp. TaxID=1872403 RepID=UPI003D9AC59D